MDKSGNADRADVVIVGGGLAGALLAYRLKILRPEISLRLLERGETLGGEHTWSFHGSDVSPTAMRWLSPFLTKSWDRHEVRFPKYARAFSSSYHSIRSEQLHRQTLCVLGEEIQFGSEVDDLSTIDADCVIDARGFLPAPRGSVAYQKFFGLDLELESPHGLSGPTLMDATCEQRDGFRFFYLLPWTPTTLLVEDTRYSDSPDVNIDEYRAEIHAYVQRRGWTVSRELREEPGVLPIPLGTWPVDASRPAIGTRGGLFHSTTGYSLPDAVRVADGLCAIPLTEVNISTWLKQYATRHRMRQTYYRFLNRMMFQGARPETRYRILEHFYRLPEPLIARFYSSTTHTVDAARILAGKPPIPILSALRSFREVSFG